VTQPSLWRVLEPKWRTALQRIARALSRLGRLFISVVAALLFWGRHIRLPLQDPQALEQVPDVGPCSPQDPGVALLTFLRHPGAVET